MKKIVYFLFVSITLLMTSCASNSATIIANGNDLSRYKYVVFGKDDQGDSELSDIILMVRNAISEKLIVVSPKEAYALSNQGVKVLAPKISVKTELWDGGHTYITINCYDYDTDQSVAVIKSSGIGITISQDQELAYKAIKKELEKNFGAIVYRYEK